MTTPVNNGSTYLANAGEGTVPQWPGIYAGTVVNNNDPLGVGRLQLNVPQVLGNAVSAWAVPLGTYYSIPNNTTTVACSFIGGDPSQPTWIGPLDLDPIINSGITAVYYTPSAPADPKIGDVWYETFAVDGTTFYGPAQIWTFNSGTSTFSWVTSAQSGAGSNPLGMVEPNITGGTITGTAFIAVGSTGQILGYTGTPANGNLDASVSPVAGTDADGNDYVSGVAAYGTGDSNAYSALTVYGDTLNGSSAAHVQATGATAEETPAKLQTWAQGSGTTEQMVTWLTGPVNSADGKGVGIGMLSSETALAAGHLSEGYLMTVNSSGVTPVLIWNTSGIQANGLLNVNEGLATAASSLSGGAVISQVDVSATLQTNNTTYSRICNVWTIPAGDAVQGTVYRLSTFGTGSTGATVETLQLQIAGLGTGVAAFTIGSSNFSANQEFYFDLVATLVVTETGSSGIVTGSIRLNLGAFNTAGTAVNQISTTGTQMAGGFAGMGAVSTAVPTAASNMTVQMKWGGPSTGQTFESYGSVFERIGGGA